MFHYFYVFRFVVSYCTYFRLRSYAVPAIGLLAAVSELQ